MPAAGTACQATLKTNSLLQAVPESYGRAAAQAVIIAVQPAVPGPLLVPAPEQPPPAAQVQVQPPALHEPALPANVAHPVHGAKAARTPDPAWALPNGTTLTEILPVPT